MLKHLRDFKKLGKFFDAIEKRGKHIESVLNYYQAFSISLKNKLMKPAEKIDVLGIEKLEVEAGPETQSEKEDSPD